MEDTCELWQCRWGGGGHCAGWTGAGRIYWLDHTHVAALGLTIGRNNSLVLHIYFWEVYWFNLQGLESGEGEVSPRNITSNIEQLKGAA